MGPLRVINAAISSPTPSEEPANDLGETRLDVESPLAAGSAMDGNPANPAGAGIEVVGDGVVRVFITDTGSSEDEDEGVRRADEDVDSGKKSLGTSMVRVKVDKGKGKASSSSPSSDQSGSEGASSSRSTREFSSMRETPLHTTNRKLDKGKRKESFSKTDDIRPIRTPSAATGSSSSAPSSSSGWPGNYSAGPSCVSITQTPPERVQKLDKGKAKVINSFSPAVPQVRIETLTGPQSLGDLSNAMSQAELLGVPLQKAKSRRHHHHRSCQKDPHYFDGLVIEHEEYASSSGGMKLQQESEDLEEFPLRRKKREALYPLILIRLPCVNGVLRGTVHFHPLLPWTLCHPPPKNLLDKIKATESAGGNARYRLCINHVLEEHQIPDSGTMEKVLQIIDDSLPNIYNDWDLGWVSVDGSREKGTYVAEWSGRFVSSQVSSETDNC
jgi:hypothetical protein